MRTPLLPVSKQDARRVITALYAAGFIWCESSVEQAIVVFDESDFSHIECISPNKRYLFYIERDSFKRYDGNDLNEITIVNSVQHFIEYTNKITKIPAEVMLDGDEDDEDTDGN